MKLHKFKVKNYKVFNQELNFRTLKKTLKA